METVVSGATLEAILGRPVHEMNQGVPLLELRDKRVLITGASGSIGQALERELGFFASQMMWSTDRTELDVTEGGRVMAAFDSFRPDVVFHLAGAKHAPAGEEDPREAMRVNAEGTWNVLVAASTVGARVVTASTCKACNPETAYGATKLIAERMTLNAGGAVARFYNVVETSGNVFDIWRQIPEGEPIPYTHCERYFLALGEAVGLILWSAILPPARYTVEPGEIRWMGDVAAAAFPSRPHEQIPPRRGDRFKEPLRGAHESMTPVDDAGTIWRVVSVHD